MIRSSAVSVDDQGTLIFGGDGGNATRPDTLIVQNQDASVSVYLGGGQERDGTETITVTTSNGVELAPGSALSLDMNVSERLYGITPSGQSAEVRILRNNG